MLAGYCWLAGWLVWLVAIDCHASGCGCDAGIFIVIWLVDFVGVILVVMDGGAIG